MKRLLGLIGFAVLIGAIGVFGAVALAGGADSDNGPHKVAICHASASMSNCSTCRKYQCRSRRCCLRSMIG